MLLNELISSKIHGHAQYRGIMHGSMLRSNACSAKILFMIGLRSSSSSATGSQRVRILISKGYRTHTMLETSNALQREPQQADLNMRRELISHCHTHFSFSAWVHAGSLVGNQRGTMPLRAMPRVPGSSQSRDNFYHLFQSG